MKIVYGNTLSAEDKATIWNIASSCGILFDTARLLFYRGINTVDKANRFLYPSKHKLHNPLLLDGIEDAIKRINYAKDHNQTVLVFGDYDADGVCATTLLSKCLKEFGINTLSIIPEREDGYGLNADLIEKINNKQKIDLVITVDCGISDFQCVQDLKEKGIDVIVTDHHEPPSILPECIKINPKLPNQKYPFTGLCGTGVAYKLASALVGSPADEYLDFVALATVADSMDLVDENRSLVVEGLKLLNSKKLRLPFKYLINDNKKPVTAQTLAYQLAPRVNAGGRMGDANSVLQLFSSENENEIFDLSVKINQYNISRQSECEVIYKQAKAQIAQNKLHKDSVILVADKNWKTGFVGIVAAKLVEDYKKPVIVFAGQDDYLKGSARSVEGLNIYEAISSVSDYLIGYGGHSQAAGVSIQTDMLETFRTKICSYVQENCLADTLSKTIAVEWEITDKISTTFAKEIERLEPFGVGNKKPYFSTRVKSVVQKPLRPESVHYTLNSNVIEILNFNGEKDSLILSMPCEKELVFEINCSVYNNRESVKGYLKQIVCNFTDYSFADPFVFDNEVKKLLEEKPITETQEFTQVKKGYGTLYVISDVNNISQLNEKIKGLNINLFEIDNKNCENTVVISPNEIPEGYSKVIYLDKPLQYINNAIATDGPVAFNGLKELSLDREVFIRIFNSIKKLGKNNVENVVKAYYKANCDCSHYTFIACLETFIELGFIKINNGIITFNEKIKRPLTDSKIYSKLLELKGL